MPISKVECDEKKLFTPNYYILMFEIVWSLNCNYDKAVAEVGLCKVLAMSILFIFSQNNKTLVSDC